MLKSYHRLPTMLTTWTVARKIPFEDPQILYYVRIGYVAVQVLVMSIYFYISMTIKAKNDKTVLKYVDAANPMTQEPGQLVNTTVRDYDLGEVSKLLRAVYTGVAMMAFLHGYMKFTQPLFVQAIMGLKGVFEATPFKIHVLGQKAEGDLKRPWKGAGGMFGAAAGGPQTDSAAIAEAEKRVAGVSNKKDD
ncbi:Inorganic phosphate transporter [Mycena kentingensis (nom. inval.)]|nr:Inorganic phosphate transporter [Mycena kentingensis (nom. inval.)]